MILMWRLLHQKDPKLAKPNPWTETHFDYIRCSLILLRSLGSEVKYNCLEEACKSIETISVTVTISDEKRSSGGRISGGDYRQQH